MVMTFVCWGCMQDKIIYSGNYCKECYEKMKNINGGEKNEFK
jgi:predicted amidophosphoribosyltransferase